MSAPQKRAARLVRCYPPAWRARYGDEFTELLVADLIERPYSPVRTADVARSALLARLAGRGLAGGSLAPADQLRSSLAALAVCVALFLTFGVGLWSQLTIGWQWSAPDAPATALAMAAMSAALLALVAIGLLAAAPIAFAAIASIARRDGARVRGSVVLFVLGACVLIVGSLHFAHGWPGTGGRPWADKSLVPAGPASFAWASTLSITSYWAHPGRLGAFPAAEVAWMALAPLAIGVTAVGAARTVARLRLSPRVLRFEAALAGAATIAMLGFLGGAAAWALGSDPGPRRLFSSGAIDVLDLAMMAVALAPALRIARRAVGISRRVSPR
jgi:hypothetical protein